MTAEPKHHIREARHDDLAHLLEIENRCFDPAIYSRMSRPSFARFIKLETATVLVSEEHGTVTGYGLLLFRKNSSLARLYSLAVLPEYQGGDTGRALFDACEKAAATHGSAGMLLEIRSDNQRLRERYEKRGYEHVGVLPGYYPDGSDGIKLRRDFR